MYKVIVYPERQWLPIFPSRLRWIPLLGILGLFNACALQMPGWEFPPFWGGADSDGESLTETGPDIRRGRFVLGKDDSIVGQLATVEVRPGDSLVDLARHYGLGQEEIAAANPGLDLWAPEPGRRALLPLQFVLPEVPRKGIAINVAAMRLFAFSGKGRTEVSTYPVGVGKEGRSTPTGDMFVQRKAEKPTWHVPPSIRRDHQLKGDPLPAVVPPGPDNPLGEYAMYLSKPSYLIHGTNKPYSIGLRASNGCLRLYPENIGTLYRATPVKMPVRIVNQPYLLGWLNGMLYLEAHAPHEELNEKAQRKSLDARLLEIERKQGLKLDWKKVDSIVREARGIPIPVAERTPGTSDRIRAAVALEPPGELYGRPKPPSSTSIENGWHIRVLETGDELTARRAAAMLNHLGPQIPARAAQLNDGSYRVAAGPFKTEKAARAAAKQLLMDFEIKGTILPPNQRLAGFD